MITIYFISVLNIQLICIHIPEKYEVKKFVFKIILSHKFTYK